MKKTSFISYLASIFFLIYFFQNFTDFNISSFQLNLHSLSIKSEVLKARWVSKTVDYHIITPFQKISSKEVSQFLESNVLHQNFLQRTFGSDKIKIFIELDIINKHHLNAWMPFFKKFEPVGIAKCYLHSKDNFIGEIELVGQIEAKGICPKNEVLKEIELKFIPEIAIALENLKYPIDNTTETIGKRTSIQIGLLKNSLNIRPSLEYHTEIWHDRSLPKYVTGSFKKSKGILKDTVYYSNYFLEKKLQDSTKTGYTIITYNTPDSLCTFEYFYPNHRLETIGYYKDLFQQIAIKQQLKYSYDFQFSPFGKWQFYRPNGTLELEQNYTFVILDSLEDVRITERNEFYSNGSIRATAQYDYPNFGQVKKKTEIYHPNGKVLRKCIYDYFLDKEDEVDCNYFVDENEFFKIVKIN